MLLGIGGGLVLLLAVVLTITLRHGTLVVEIDEQLGKDVQVAVSQGGQKVQVADARSGWTLSLSAGKYDLAVETGKGDRSNLPVGPEGASHKLNLSPFPFGNDDFQLDSESITVTRGGQVKVKVTLKPAPLAVAPFDAKQAESIRSTGPGSWACRWR